MRGSGMSDQPSEIAGSPCSEGQRAPHRAEKDAAMTNVLYVAGFLFLGSCVALGLLRVVELVEEEFRELRR